MKALKEKRIGLRSLWRRGLVILSLFALVFASCSDSSGTDVEVPTEPTWREIAKAEILGTPATQYEGTRFNTTGLSVKVTYADGGTDEFKPPVIQFRVTPPVVGGFVVNDDIGQVFWFPVKEYTVSSAVNSGLAEPAVRVYPNITVMPVQRGQVSAQGLGNTSFMTVPVYGWTSSQQNTSAHTNLQDGALVSAWRLPTLEGYVMNAALNLIGDLDQEIRVDDDPDYSKFRIQATYADLEKKEIVTTDKDVPITWQIRPYYLGVDGKPGGTVRDKAGPGDLLVTIGKPIISDPAAAVNAATAQSTGPYATAAGQVYYGLGNISVMGKYGATSLYTVATRASGIPVPAGSLTAVHPFAKVYHITGIELDPQPDLENLDSLPCMYYWEKDIYQNWRGLDKVPIKINYVDGSFKNVKIADIAGTAMKGTTSGMVWYNENPYVDGSQAPKEYDFDKIGIYDVRKSSTAANKLPTTNGGDGLRYNKIPQPVLKLNYRGATVDIPVDIWTKVEQIDAEYTSKAAIQDDRYIWVDAKVLDNDIKGADAKWYSEQVNVWAVMTSARGNVGTKDNKGYVALRWFGSTAGITSTAPKDKGDANNETDQKSGLSALKPETADLAYQNQDGTWKTGDANNRLTLLYGMDFGVHPTWRVDAGQAKGDWETTGLGSNGTSRIDVWGQVNTIKNNNAEKPVTFYFAVPTNGDNSGITSPKVLKAQLPVMWRNIRTR